MYWSITDVIVIWLGAAQVFILCYTIVEILNRKKTSIDIRDNVLTIKSHGQFNDNDFLEEFERYTINKNTRIKIIGKDTGCHTIDLLLRNNHNITDICLSDNEIDVDGIIRLYSNPAMSHLKNLDLTKNCIGSDSMIYVSNLLVKYNFLQSLNLTDCFIKRTGILLLFDAINRNTCLRSLELGNNYLVPSCGDIIGRSLKRNASLRALCLYGNDLTDRGVIPILKGLVHNTTLQFLDLGHNHITNGILEFVDETHVEKLFLYDNEDITFEESKISHQDDKIYIRRRKKDVR